MLHTVNKSPFEKTSLQTCLRLSRKGDCILLLEDGVYAALAGTETEPLLRDALTTRAIYALTPDLRARGIAQNALIPGVQCTDYAGFVALTLDCDSVQSWF